MTGFNSFQFAADRVHALVEARRVTRSGGLLGFGLWGLPQHCQALTIMGALRSLMPPPPQTPPGTAAAPTNVPLATPGVLDALLRSAGWHPKTTGEVDCPFIYADVDSAVRTFMSAGGMSLAIKASDEDVHRTLAEALAPFRTDAGGYRLENRFIFTIAEAP